MSKAPKARYVLDPQPGGIEACMVPTGASLEAVPCNTEAAAVKFVRERFVLEGTGRTGMNEAGRTDVA